MEFDRQRAKTIHALAALDADVVGLAEVENDEGDDQAIADLVAGVNDLLGADTYQFVDTGRIGGDAIRIGFIYKPAQVTPVGGFATAGWSFSVRHQHPPAAGAVVARQCQRRAVLRRRQSPEVERKLPGGLHDVNADQGDGQDCWNADRLLAANEIADWITTDPYFAADPDVLLLGDFNAYAQEDPIRAFAAAGYTDTVAQFIGADAYSYVFDGQWGYLDSGLATSRMLPQITGVADSTSTPTSRARSTTTSITRTNG